MAIPAHWEDAETSETTRQPRRKLQLEALGALPSGASAEILVHDISASGLLIESPLALAADERIAIVLPEAGETWAQVVWASGKLFGCRFDAPISAATLSAAQLRSAVGERVDILPRGLPAARGSFGSRFQRLRQERGLSQADIATRMGVSKPTVWAWEHDRARPIGSRIEDLAEILGIGPAELVGTPGASAGGPDVVERSREEIAAVYGISPDRVRIWMEL